MRLLWAIALSAMTSAAAAQPNLVIDAAASGLEAGGCGVSEPLAVATIVIRNDGDAAAVIRTGALDRAPATLLALYDPERRDIAVEAARPVRLAPGEQATVDLAIGAGARKRGRLREAPGALDAPRLDADALSRDERRAIQSALQSLGFYRGRVDGLFGRGTAAAVRRFQAARGVARTGALTLADVGALAERAGVALAPDQTAAAPTARLEADLIASVDPYDRIRERDERDNTLRFSVVVDCF